MRSCVVRGLLSLVLCSALHAVGEQPPVTTPKPAVLLLNQESEFAAILSIHGQLDDNDDGSVDLSESSEFETELCGASLENQQNCWSSDKSKRFHQTDKQITSMELWTTWHNNKAINWSTHDVVAWLENSVHLSQYSEMFHYHQITGRHLPQLAVNTNQILQSLLLVSNHQHKNKIQLRAMDVVLFGPPIGSGYWKDAVLALSLVLSVCGVLYALRQRYLAQSKIDSFLDDFRVKEEELSKLKSKLELERTLNDEEENGSTDSIPTPPSEDDSLPTVFSRSNSQDTSSPLVSQVREENQSLRYQLRLAESQFSSKMSKMRGLLQECSKKEWTHLDNKRRIAEEQMSRAQKVCDKIKKKRYSLFGSFHLANSSALEEAGLQITKAVNKMHSISEYFDEYHSRWEQIESICGYSIVSSTASSPTHHTHTIDSMLSFTREGSPLSLSSVTSLHHLRQRADIAWPTTSSARFKSSPESSLETMDKPYLVMDSEPDIGAAGVYVRNEPSRLIHSSSVPVIRKGLPEPMDTKCADSTGGISFVAPGSIERTAARGLEPIKEEQYSVAKKRARSFTRKSRSSEV